MSFLCCSNISNDKYKNILTIFMGFVFNSLVFEEENSGSILKSCITEFKRFYENLLRFATKKNI